MTKKRQNQDFKLIYEGYQARKSEREKYKSLWDEISRYTGIGVDPDYMIHNKGDKSGVMDQFIDDPTSAIAVNQQADYMIGIMWGTGDKVFSVVPSRNVLEIANVDMVKDYFDFVTEQALYHMNHSQAGLHTCLRPYAYDQAAFGTSGIGTFPNDAFKERIEENALLFRSYGVDNSNIDEGKSGLVEIGDIVYHWKLSRIVSEFCVKNGDIDPKAIALLPKPMKDAYKQNRMNEEFDIVWSFMPRENYDPKLRGARGARYRGVWYMEAGEGNSVFHEESYHERPASFCRQIKVRGEIYGRSCGTMLLSSIRAVNFMVGTAIEIMEKMSNPSLGMFNNGIFGDSVLDTSPDGLTIFNEQFVGKNGQPVFPIYDVGDPSGIVKFLIPYLNEKIVTAFKIDVLLDFSSAKDMTATESMQRYVIRGKSLSGMLQQQKIEVLEPTTRRSISVLDNLGELGINAKIQDKRAKVAKAAGQQRRIIPDAVLQCKKSGRAWYEIKFNNELEKLTRTEAVQKLSQILQVIGAMAAVYPMIVEAVDWYQLLQDINENLDSNSKILIGATEFKKKIQAAAEQQQKMLALQAGQGAASMGKDMATAQKTSKEAQNVQIPGGQS